MQSEPTETGDVPSAPADIGLDLGQLSEEILCDLTDGLIVLDAQGRIRWLNEAMRQMAALNEPLSLPCDPAQDGDCPSQLRLLLVPGGEIWGPYNVSLGLPGGANSTFHVIPSRLRPPAQGELRDVRDVSADRRAWHEFHRLVAEVAHEVRTPLQHILSYADLLTDIPDLTEKQRRGFLGDIQGEARTLALLLDDLLQWERLGQAGLAIQTKRTPLDQLASTIVAKFRPRAQQSHLTLESQIEPNVWAMTDPLRLEQVLSNVLNNAFTYLQSGAAVCVQLTRSKGDAVISVSDTGRGISPETLKRIFEPFFQGHDERATHRGVGLGLSISRQIMQALGGSIDAESRPGVGSTFYIRLPALSD